jgi:hypothetical protein
METATPTHHHIQRVYMCLTTLAPLAREQLFIFYTIKTFGPVVFAIIMSTRILLSIAASCFLYGHPIPPLGACVDCIIGIGFEVGTGGQTDGRTGGRSLASTTHGNQYQYPSLHIIHNTT